MKTPIPPPNPFEKRPALEASETAMTDLIASGGIAMKWIADQAGKAMSHAERADLVRLEIAVSDLLFALRPRP